MNTFKDFRKRVNNCVVKLDGFEAFVTTSDDTVILRVPITQYDYDIEEFVLIGTMEYRFNEETFACQIDEDSVATVTDMDGDNAQVEFYRKVGIATFPS